jgi:hypothetical protein
MVLRNQVGPLRQANVRQAYEFSSCDQAILPDLLGVPGM